MAELVYRNTDGRTYTYADQNDLYRVLNETYDSVSGSADFSWFHFSGGDNRVAMLPGEGDGMNIVSDGKTFHLAHFSSETLAKVSIGEIPDTGTGYLSADSNGKSLEKIEVLSLLPEGGSDYNYRYIADISSLSVREKLYSYYEYESYGPSPDFWFRMVDTSVLSTSLKTLSITDIRHNAYSGDNWVTVSSTEENLCFPCGIISGRIDPTDCVYYGSVSRSRNISWRLHAFLQTGDAASVSHSVTSYTGHSSYSYPRLYSIVENGIIANSGISALKDSVSTYTASLARTTSMSFISSVDNSSDNFGYWINGPDTVSFTKYIAETETRVCASVNSNIVLTSIFIDSDPAQAPYFAGKTMTYSYARVFSTFLSRAGTKVVDGVITTCTQEGTNINKTSYFGSGTGRVSSLNLYHHSLMDPLRNYGFEGVQVVTYYGYSAANSQYPSITTRILNYDEWTQSKSNETVAICMLTRFKLF